MPCPKCSHDQPESLAFCSNCGSPTRDLTGEELSQTDLKDADLEKVNLHKSKL